MTSKGQITVPVAIRKQLGLRPGEQIGIELKGNTAVVKANDWQQGLAAVRAEIAAQLKARHHKPLSDRELDEAIDQAGEVAALARYDRSQEH